MSSSSREGGRDATLFGEANISVVWCVRGSMGRHETREFPFGWLLDDISQALEGEKAAAGSMQMAAYLALLLSELLPRGRTMLQPKLPLSLRVLCSLATT
jgi:hypothetical protein